MDNKMFCYQCQETARGTGCTMRGVCGKTDDVANLHYTLIHVLKGISFWSMKARSLDIVREDVNHFITKMLFSTITNVNFDPAWYMNRIKDAFSLRDKIKNDFNTAFEKKNNKKFEEVLPDEAIWYEAPDQAKYEKKGYDTNPLAIENEDLRALREWIMYSLKGMAAYGDHALVLGFEDDEIWKFMQQTLVDLINKQLTLDELVALTLKTGEYGVKVMALLDEANTKTFGDPVPTEVNLGVQPGPGILISGHDLLDLKELLEQTEGKGINIYTHGEMLPANAYPELKKFKHLVGNYGQSWYMQYKDFDTFNGPVLLTTNCLIPPKETYFERLFTTGLVGWPGVKHIEDRVKDKQKDFSPIIEMALKSESPQEIEQGKITIGFGRNTLLGAADKIVEAVKAGAIKRFVVMGGCEGRHKGRSYYAEVAKSLPQDTLILTAGCAKYKYNKMDLGKIGDFPRIIDAGQCNDNYSLAVIALKLAEVFEVNSINDLPISFDIAWYEQKAVLVLSALLYLGIKNIRLGPSPPGFVTPNVLKVISEKFNLMLIDEPAADVAAMMKGE